MLLSWYLLHYKLLDFSFRWFLKFWFERREERLEIPLCPHHSGYCKVFKKSLYVALENIWGIGNLLLLVIVRPVSCMTQEKDIHLRRNGQPRITKMLENQSICNWRVSCQTHTLRKVSFVIDHHLCSPCKAYVGHSSGGSLKLLLDKVVHDGHDVQIAEEHHTVFFDH